MDGTRLVLDEEFLYDDGERANRTWTIDRLESASDGILNYSGRAADVKATALQLKQAAKELFDTQKNRNGNATKLSTPTRDFLNTINKLPAGQLADVLTGTL